MEKRRHPDQTEFRFARENEQSLPLGKVLDDLEAEFDKENLDLDEEELRS